MRTYLLYIIGLIVLPLAIATCLFAHLPVTAVAVGLLLSGLCFSLYGRINRLRYAYRETERENERLHTRVTEAERQLQYLRQLTENVDTALFVCNTDGRIDWMNHAARALATMKFASMGCSDSLPYGGKLEGAILQAIANHEEVVDGCALSTVLLRIDGQRRLVVALKDVSMLMQRQEMEAWQQLIRVLTHEIMNSLTPIISISETLAESLPQGGGQEGASVINRRCHALLDFVESYRQLTRIKAPERTTFPVSDLFEHIKVLFPQVDIKEQVPSRGDLEGAALCADRSQLEQVLINLVKNAYESGATEVRLTAQPLPSPMGGGGSAIRVEDNGRGMAPDVLANAFIPFYTTKPSGTGIGLSLCRQIILKHGGRISVESQEGRGTTFTIELPQA